MSKCKSVSVFAASLRATIGGALWLAQKERRESSSMSKPNFVMVAAGATALVLSGAAQASVVFTPGNNPQPDEENIMFETAQTGTTITGDTNMTSTPVLFTSTESLSTQGLGQASLLATDGNPITGTVTFTVPGFTFNDYIFDPMHGTGDATVTAVATDGTFTDTISLGGGQNFLTLTTTGGETISSVAISAPGGFDTYDQPRVSGLADVPEPASLSLLGAGLIGLGILYRRRRWS